MLFRQQVSDLPNPVKVTSYQPDLQEFMRIVDENSERLNEVLEELPPDDRAAANQALYELRVSSGVDVDTEINNNQLDEGRLMMVRDIYSLMQQGRLTIMP